MPLEPTVFAQITAGLFPAEVDRCAGQFPMPRSSRSFSAYDHFLALCFGQLTARDSLRDLVASLSARPDLHYHLGFRGRITRTNLAYANEHRDWRVFASLAEVLMRRTARLYHDPVAEDWPQVAFALDSSIIGLSAELCPWAYFRRPNDAALKLHTLIGLHQQLPHWAAVTEASVPDMKLLDNISVMPGAYYVMDRGYLDFTRLARLEREGAWFIVRSKRHVVFQVLASRPVDKTGGLRCDQVVRLQTRWGRRVWPGKLRRIRFRDPERGRSLVFLSNQFDLDPALVCELYRRRWQVELFFKWLKEHLKLEKFYGRTDNAVRCQIWGAICTFLLVAVARKQLKIGRSMCEILQIVSLNCHERIPLTELISQKLPVPNIENPQNAQQFFRF